MNVGQRQTLERSLSSSDLEEFARVSGDFNPIHVDGEFAAETKFGKPVAHGMLLFSILRGLIEKSVPVAIQIEQELIFPAPAYLEEPIEFSIELVDKQNRALKFDLNAITKKNNICVCAGTCVVEEQPV